jgi:uroporphyrinogen-III decarboxylase
MPWFADLTYWWDSHKIIGDIPESWQEGISLIHRRFNVGEYVPGTNAFGQTFDEKVEEIREEKDDRKTIIRWNTPLGSLQATREYNPLSYSRSRVEYPVKTADDLKVLRYLTEHSIYTPTYDRVLKLDRDLGEYGLPIVALPGTPVAQLILNWAGVMTTSYLFNDAPREMELTLQAIAESQERAYDIMAEAPCDYVIFCDNLTSNVYGRLFKTYMADYYKKQIAYLHEHGKKVITHVDGTLRGVLEQLEGTGIDCAEALTPLPVGDVSLKELRELAGEKIVLWGGIPGAMFAPSFSRDEIKRQVLELIKYHRESRKFVIGVADQVPPDADMNLVGFISELIEEYGRY